MSTPLHGKLPHVGVVEDAFEHEQARFARGAGVDDEQVEGLLAKAFEGPGRVGGEQHAQSLFLEFLAKHILQVLVALGDEDRRRQPGLAAAACRQPGFSRRISRTASSSCDGV